MDSHGPKAEEIGQVSFAFDILSLLIDLTPMMLAMVLSRLEKAVKHQSPFALFCGAILNIVLVFHLLFVLDTAYLFLLGLRKSAQKFRCKGVFMMVVSMFLLCVCAPIVIYLMDQHFHVSKDQPLGPTVYAVTVLVVFVANVSALVGPWKTIGKVKKVQAMDRESPQAEAIHRELAQDMDVEMHYGIGMFVCLVTTVDSCYFIIYAVVLSRKDSLLMIVSIMNAFFAVILLGTLIKKSKCYKVYQDGRSLYRALDSLPTKSVPATTQSTRMQCRKNVLYCAA